MTAEKRVYKPRGTCKWEQASAARGVYRSTCSVAAFIHGVPPKPGSECPLCGRKVKP